ncbi:acyl-CoA N-acyltransferase [Sparassis latifolia]|uniref:Acyl-CoA N-acyltransferase n=1 Tax=Sparassis crispa TaxID=139825 RepID=A0A401GPZ4_9APHY|nr:acyl-CoA N-acyltransferase [Sparassis crispa]GBE84288.1 acyl-CoA N-acyltransferase [Sparassis crispa]
MSVFYDPVNERELEDAYAIEALGYPEDEAATLETFRYRQAQAPDLFLGAYLSKEGGRTLIGYVCSTLSPSTSLTHDSMSTHVPGAASVCLHSVCVRPGHRRKGIALGLLKEYTARLACTPGYERVLLIAHEELLGLYEQAGFQLVGRSAVVHGSRPWFEMQTLLTPAPPQEPQQVIPVGLWEALQSSSTRARLRARLLTAFPGGVQDVADASENKFDLLCPREGCGSVILKSGVASLVERESLRLEPPENPPHSALPPLAAPPNLMHWWRVTPNAMAFENIGFSRAVKSDTSTNKRLKLLLCAECDLGPLGWCEEGSSEFWLACNRVGYRE